MNSHESQPKLPIWPFIAAYTAAISLAFIIGYTSKQPYSPSAMMWMALCVLLGMIVGLVPIVLAFERQKNETLDERQRALEALARTVHSSAEQISIATGGLNEIAELAQKNLRHAEHLPQKLQEKIAEFQSQLSVAADAEKEELERELLALRTSESERLDTVSQRIAKSAGEWTKLETATQQHLTGANEALGKLALGTASAIGKAQASAEQALTQARTEAARTIGEASGQATRAIEAAKTAALSEIDAKFTAAAQAAIERVTTELAAKLAALSTSSVPLPSAAKPAIVEPPPLVSPVAEAPAAVPAEPAPPPVESAATTAPTEAVVTPPAKRPRKPRREEVPAVPAAPPEAPAAAPADSATVPAPEPVVPESQPVAPAAPPISPPPVAVESEPAPVPTARIIEIAAVTPSTTQPFATDVSPIASSAPTAAAPTPGGPAAAPRKRAKKPETPPPEAHEEPSLALDLDGGSPADLGVAERVLTSDGATRLLVTAYIGIGNRLFIRGAGPGLNWDKGVPLQFVSIGKWRWETSDAADPVQFKLYKNDEVECAALGSQTLDPGHQQELTAAF